MPRYLLSFLFLFYVMFCFVLTSPPLMLCVYLQTFEAALFWKKKNILMPGFEPTTSVFQPHDQYAPYTTTVALLPCLAKNRLL